MDVGCSSTGVADSEKERRDKVKRLVDSKKVKMEMVASSVRKLKKHVKSKRNGLQASSSRQDGSRKRKSEVREDKTENVEENSKRAKKLKLVVENKREASVAPPFWKKHTFSDAGCSYTHGSRTVCVFDRSKAGSKDKKFELISPFKLWGILNRVLGLNLSENCFMKYHKVMFEFADKSDPRKDPRLNFLFL